MYVFRQDLRIMDLDKNTQEYITTKYPISLMLNLDFKIFLKQFHTGSCILWTDKNIHMGLEKKLRHLHLYLSESAFINQLYSRMTSL